MVRAGGREYMKTMSGAEVDASSLEAPVVSEEYGETSVLRSMGGVVHVAADADAPQPATTVTDGTRATTGLDGWREVVTTCCAR